MTTAPLVSVLMSSRNGARFLPEALAGLAAQTLPGVEYVLVDDGSTDDTPAMLSRFAETQPGARVLRTTGIGLAGALALAARESSGRFLARHDDDDRSRPQRFELQSVFLLQHPDCDVVGSEATIIDEHGKAVARYGVPIVPAQILRVSRRDPPFVHGSVMMRRDVYERVGGYRPAFRSSEDLDLWLRIPPARFANLEEPLYEWRRHASSAYSKARGTMIEYAAIARAFAAERHDCGADSIEMLERHGDVEALLATYPRRGRLALELGIAYLRDGHVRTARAFLARALADAATRERAAFWWLVTWPAQFSARARRAGSGSGS